MLMETESFKILKKNILHWKNYGHYLKIKKKIIYIYKFFYFNYFIWIFTEFLQTFNNNK